MLKSVAPGAPLDHAAIAARIPHHGNMCLLERVLAWDEQRIECEALSHTAPNNPLRADHRLGAAVGVEYAAQAMAVHGALLAGASGAPKRGYLTAVRSLSLHVLRLDNLPGALHVVAERLSGDQGLILYQFHVLHGTQRLLEGRASVVLDAQQP